MNPCNYPHHKIRFMNREQEIKNQEVKESLNFYGSRSLLKKPLFDAIWCYFLPLRATLPTVKEIFVSYYSPQEENFNIDHV